MVEVIRRIAVIRGQKKNNRTGEQNGEGNVNGNNNSRGNVNAGDEEWNGLRRRGEGRWGPLLYFVLFLLF